MAKDQQSRSNPITLIGRSSSHFTRVTRIFAAEMGVEYAFQVVRDLMSQDPEDFGGNPALRLPTLRTPRATWFGALNICRELHRLAGGSARTVWPEDLQEPLLANAQELVVQAMATEVNLIMAGLANELGNRAHLAKMRTSLENSLRWLDENVGAVCGALRSDRELSYLEVTLFCLVAHLQFRNVLPTEPYAHLAAFCHGFAERASAQHTAYQFDA